MRLISLRDAPDQREQLTNRHEFRRWLATSHENIQFGAAQLKGRNFGRQIRWIEADGCESFP